MTLVIMTYFKRGARKCKPIKLLGGKIRECTDLRFGDDF